MEAPQIFEHIDNQLNYTPFQTKWMPYSNKSVVIGQTPKMEGIIQFHSLQKNEQKLILEQKFGKGLKCCQWNVFNKQPQLAIGDISGKMFIFDLEKQKVNFEVQGHKGMVNSLDTAGGLYGDGPVEIVTGCKDGFIKVWDIRQSAPVLQLEPDQSTECWAVCFGNVYNHEERCLVGGYDNGDLKIFDMKQNQLIYDENLKNGICGVQFDRKDIKMNKLVCSTLEGKIYLFDMRTFCDGFACLEEKVNEGTVWGVSHLPQNREIFGVQGGDGIFKVYKYNYPPQRCIQNKDGQKKGVIGTLEVLNYKKIADQPIVSFDWNREKIGLGLSVSLDQKQKVVITTKLNKY